MPPPQRHDEALLDGLRETFATRYGRAPEFLVRAPGRVNLIGEHTDYNDGWVLPCAIDRDTVVAGAAREGDAVRILSREASGEDAPAEVRVGERQQRAGDWVDYLRGAITVVREETGRTPPGLDLAVASAVPAESGLSSSAAFGVALVTALERALGLSFEPEARGRLAWRSEREFVGVPCGIMDQYASALGRRDHALALDCRSREVAYVPLPAERLRILVAHSGVRRRLATGGYGDRRAECQAACAAAAPVLGRELASLREVGEADLPALETALDAMLFRRLRHVVTENRRVADFRHALAAADSVRAGRILREGHRSLRDDYEVSIEELDALCEIADATNGVYGSRLTGAGFGGCTVHLVSPDESRRAADHIATTFEQRYGRRPPVFEVIPAQGAEILS